MSRDLGRDVPDLEKLYARKLWADFSYPTDACARNSHARNSPHLNFREVKIQTPRAKPVSTVKMKCLVDVPDIFYFISARGQGKGGTIFY